MNKEAYLSQLLQLLKPLPTNEQTEIMADYEEHFEMAKLSVPLVYLVSDTGDLSIEHK